VDQTLEAVLVEVQVMENDVSLRVSCGGQAVQERVGLVNCLCV